MPSGKIYGYRPALTATNIHLQPTREASVQLRHAVACGRADSAVGSRAILLSIILHAEGGMHIQRSSHYHSQRHNSLTKCRSGACLSLFASLYCLGR